VGEARGHAGVPVGCIETEQIRGEEPPSARGGCWEAIVAAAAAAATTALLEETSAVSALFVAAAPCPSPVRSPASCPVRKATIVQA
jgi:hypothetical protein